MNNNIRHQLRVFLTQFNYDVNQFDGGDTKKREALTRACSYKLMAYSQMRAILIAEPGKRLP